MDMTIRHAFDLSATQIGVSMNTGSAVNTEIRSTIMKKNAGLKVKTKVRSGGGNWPH
jgi:hypothetical protein